MAIKIKTNGNGVELNEILCGKEGWVLSVTGDKNTVTLTNKFTGASGTAPTTEVEVDGATYANIEELKDALGTVLFKGGGSGPGTEASWGGITGDIEDQADLVDYISENGGGGSSRIPDWGEGHSYNKDQTVIIYEGDNAAMYRSLVDDNDSSPLFTNPWEYVGEVGDILNWDSETNYNSGDKVLYPVEEGGEDLVVLFESAIDSPSSSPSEGMQVEWIIKAVLADPVEWDANVEYSPYLGALPRAVSYGLSYYSTLVNVKGASPLSSNQWEKLSILEFDENDNLYLSSTDESSFIKLSKGIGSSSFEKKTVANYGGNTYHVDNAMTMSGLASDIHTPLSLGKSVTISGAYEPTAASKLSLATSYINGASNASLASLTRGGSGAVRRSILELYNNDGTSLIQLLAIDDTTSKTTGFRIGSHSSHNIFTDQFNEIGLRYADDYSANGSQHDRWIPDWEAVKTYVDENAGSSLTFENGLTEEDGVVKLGLEASTLGTTNKGLLTEPLYLIKGEASNSIYEAIGIEDKHLFLEVGSEGIASLNKSSLKITSPVTGPFGGIVFESRLDNKFSALSVEPDSFNLTVFIDGGIKGLTISEDMLHISDSINNKGLEYATDYSTNGKLNDRWIPDWGAVKAYVDENAGSPLTFENGLTEENGVVKLGGEVTEGFYLETPGLDYNAGFGMGFDSNHANSVFSTWSDTGLNPSVTFQSYVSGSSSGAAIQVVNDNGAYELVMSTEDGFIITDDFNGRGVEYYSDYSANYTDRSLVDKAFVDSRLSEAQRNAINALVSPETDYADMAEATAAIKSIIDALKAV